MPTNTESINEFCKYCKCILGDNDKYMLCGDCEYQMWHNNPIVDTDTPFEN